MSLTDVERNELLKEMADDHGMKFKIGWHNFSGNVKSPNALLLNVENRDSLQHVMRWIYKINSTKPISERIIVRVAAGGHDDKYSQSYSFTPGAEGDVIIRLTGAEFSHIERTASENVMQLGGNLQIGMADQRLYDEFNLVMPTSSLIPYVTVAGLSANAGHGTGKDQPSFAGLIRAMTLCLANGDIVRIDESHSDFKTIRGAHLGLFGIVLNVELQCMPAKKLKCVMKKRSLNQFLSEVMAGLYEKYYCVSVMYVPTYQRDELTSDKIKNVIIYCYNPVDKSCSNVNYRPFIDSLAQGIEILVQEKFKISDLLLAVPSLIPEYMRYLVTRTAIGSEDELVTGPWPMFHYQTAFPHVMNDMSFVFPLANSNRWQKIVDAYVKFVSEMSLAEQRQEYTVAYATYGRYFAGTNGGLSTSAHRDNEHVFGFDVVSLPGLKGFQHFRQQMTHYFIDELHAKPHWGKYIPENVNYAAIYGESYQQFIQALQSWHSGAGLAFERSPFLNEFTCRILNLPHLMPASSLGRSLSQDNIMPDIPVVELARVAALCVKGDDEYAEQLRRHLNQLSTENTISLSSSSSSLFANKSTVENLTSRGTITDSTRAVDERKKSKGCCTLM